MLLIVLLLSFCSNVTFVVNATMIHDIINLFDICSQVKKICRNLFFPLFGTQYYDVCRPVNFRVIIAHWTTNHAFFITGMNELSRALRKILFML